MCKPVRTRNYTRRFVGVMIVLCAGLGTERTFKSTVVAAQPATRLKGLHFSSGRLGGERPDASCDFNYRVRFHNVEFDLSVDRDRIALTLPAAVLGSRSCPSDRQEITITRIGFSRGLRRVGARALGPDLATATIAGAINAFRAKTITRYFLSLDYQEPGGVEASATFYFDNQDPAAVLTSLSRVSERPLHVTESEAATLGRSVNVSVSSDPHRRLLANVPTWESKAFTLEGDISQILPDVSTALANRALWDLETGTLRRRLTEPPPRGHTQQEWLGGVGRWLLWARNSGPINGKNAMQAGEVTIVDTTAAARVARIGPLPYMNNVLLVPDAALALAVFRTPSAERRFESSVSAIALDRGEVVWRATVPTGLRIGRSDAARVLVFGRDWIRLWNGAAGENLFDASAFLSQADIAPVAILEAAVVKGRIIVVYRTKAGGEIAALDISSGRVLNRTQLSGSIGGAIRTRWSPDGNILVMLSQDRLSLWDTETLRLVGDLNPPPGRGRVFAEFDASGELLATMGSTSEGLDRHVVIIDVHTRTPVGQCLLGDAAAMQFVSNGRTLLGYRDNRLLACIRPD